ncbi:MAG: polymerase subunit beta protein [Candidatus Falkowbacteria bacterium GW2011_GWC2_38_22]|uniref:Polymerase subunit beta protein n=1 Tax=Candidatus Falkowbacteria bacterium GW2011_GWE1_38_31 TaxID=1618638 RepID=A0A0G0M8K8_9BACT|nr:MAG: polymerase subunit beta protein [Candidatus Falkowbacteria bacterium GW2011_GWF2_38_1205]KKQ61212.1 MAG: polymerase subunit beta protein [Candidatus Falkowbacteria bacterium GW2011_GWC2_38_22]KKQ63282.1 MAG: polymerase subunit beta protein [Candidatus Falkowbacteria bacterium GW2011_GWF1_38_22]KKQ65600.1 MAG: polymerase subunit beta protein [Candidatus Falkowbacteria bacterium GW2011_GWE2_38_254]KKQ70014.1 MAG: polymerase subunit beta protein [Candidatus Falkowbacteria bacterium GW2011_
MLDILIKSKIRKKILLLFIYNPKNKYYINQIARLVKTSSGTAYRELNVLLKSDILLCEKEANLTYYRLNQINPLLKNIKEIISQTIGIEIMLKKKLAKMKGINFAFIFGSYAKNSFKSDSDIDLYVIGDIGEKELYRETMLLEKEINHPINYHLSSLAEFKQNLKKSFFHQSILKNYIFLIGNQDEFKNIIR